MKSRPNADNAEMEPKQANQTQDEDGAMLSQSQSRCPCRRIRRVQVGTRSLELESRLALEELQALKLTLEMMASGTRA